jgi:hypothetical protein
MKNHSLIVDDFFINPKRVKELIDQEDIQDYKFSDGVVYPGIIKLPTTVHDELYVNMQAVFGPRFKEVLSFARYSFEHTKPPHWAHSDGNIAQFIGLIYLNEDKNAQLYGTCTLRHNKYGFETHPKNDFEKDILLKQANSRSEWKITFKCPAKFNRLFCLSADLIHAAMGQYGKTKADGRLVLSVFFNLE